MNGLYFLVCGLSLIGIALVFFSLYQWMLVLRTNTELLSNLVYDHQAAFLSD